MRVLTLYSSPSCSLCLPVFDLLKTFESETINVEVRDITKSKDDFARFKHDIPVVFLDGKEIARHTLDKKQVEEALSALMKRHS